MSATLISASEPHEGDAIQTNTAVGGGKPLHRFMRGQPKITGIIVLVLGSSLFIVSIAIAGPDFHLTWSNNFILVFWQGLLFIVCGILYILTEHNPTKKTVTVSLALSIVALLGSVCATFLLVTNTIFNTVHIDYSYESNMTEFDIHGPQQYLYTFLAMEVVFIVNILVGAIILIVMSTLARSALRSTKSQAIVAMSTMQTK